MKYIRTETFLNKKFVGINDSQTQWIATENKITSPSVYQLFVTLQKWKKNVLSEKLWTYISKLELSDFDDVSSELTVGFLIGFDY